MKNAEQNFLQRQLPTMVKIARLDDAFLEIFKLEAGPVEGQSLPLENKKKQIRKGEKKEKMKTPKRSKLDFCACPSKFVVKRDASGKKGMLSCCKCLFE